MFRREPGSIAARGARADRCSTGARRLAAKIEIKHTPKHGSWLNIAELEFAVLGRTVFKKRIADKEQLQREPDAICAERNAEGKAREKMAWAYPKIDKESS